VRLSVRAFQSSTRSGTKQEIAWRRSSRVMAAGRLCLSCWGMPVRLTSAALPSGDHDTRPVAGGGPSVSSSPEVTGEVKVIWPVAGREVRPRKRHIYRCMVDGRPKTLRGQ